VRAGAALICCVLPLVPACDLVPARGGPAAGPLVLELAHDTIRLGPGVGLVDIGVRRQPGGYFDPAHAVARQGDVVRFTAADRASHTVVFLGAELRPEAREFLERTGQMRSPPFLAEGAAWVISLEGAPAGEYPFRCTTHNVRGQLSVRPRD
jgi:plastocyanin